MFCLKKIFIFIISVLFCFNVYAQSNSNNLAAYQERIQRGQQQLNEEEFRRAELANALKVAEMDMAAISGEDDEGVKKSAKRCINIKVVDYSGNSVISDSQLDEIVDKFKGKCLSVSLINDMLNEFTNLYISKGYITSRAYLKMPQKRLKEGFLEIKIIEGKVSEIKGLKKSEIFFAFPRIRGEVLDLKDIEQGMDQINRLASNRATMDIKPTDNKEGFSDIVINNQKSGTSNASLFTDNAGSLSIGEWRVGTRFYQDNLFNLNDQLNLSFTHVPQLDYGRKGSNAFTFGMNVPFGYWTFSNYFSYSGYKTSLILPVSKNLLYSYGDSFNNTIKLDRLFFRGKKYKISAGLGLNYKMNNNYNRVLDLSIKSNVSSRALTVLNFEIPMLFYIGSGVFYFKPSLVFGLNAFGAVDDKSSGSYRKAQYTAYKLYSYYLQKFKYFSYMITLDSQYTADVLYSSESFYIGSEYSVRGFKHYGVQGDMGFSLRNDFTLDLSALFNSNNFYLKLFRPSIFLDYGLVDSNNNAKTASLLGSGVNLRVVHKYFNISLGYGYALDKEDWMEDNYAFYLSASVSYRF